MALAIEARRIAGRLAVLDVAVAAGAIIGPAVIGTHDVAGVALLGAAQQRALVAADIEEARDAALRVARHQHRGAADVGRDEVVGPRDLRLEGEKAPGALEDEFLLEREQIGIGEDIAMHPEDSLFGPVVDIGCDVPWRHIAASPSRTEGA